MKIFTLIFAMMLSLLWVNAQNSQNTDRVRAAKIEFFSKKLDLTNSESEKFWPIYNDYQSRKSKLSNERKNLMRYYEENKSNMSPEEVSKSLNRYIGIEQEQAHLLARFNEKFKQVLADEKVLNIYIAEIEFRNYLLKQLRTQQSGIKPRN